MAKPSKDLRGCATAFECRDQLPALSAWMSDEVMKQLPLWKGQRFARGQEYFDLDNPDRGPFVATGNENQPSDYTYVCREDVSERAWAQLITWRQPISLDQGEQIARLENEFGAGPEFSAAGEAGPPPGE